MVVRLVLPYLRFSLECHRSRYECLCSSSPMPPNLRAPLSQGFVEPDFPAVHPVTDWIHTILPSRGDGYDIE